MRVLTKAVGLPVAAALGLAAGAVAVAGCAAVTPFVLVRAVAGWFRRRRRRRGSHGRLAARRLRERDRAWVRARAAQQERVAREVGARHEDVLVMM